VHLSEAAQLLLLLGVRLDQLFLKLRFEPVTGPLLVFVLLLDL
jgi:hypothetical protein